MTRFALVLALVSAPLASAQPAGEAVRPGEIWPDTEGVHINAHGGGVLFHDGSYYWYGEHKEAGRSGRAEVGVRVYRSEDLVSWDNAGVAMPVSADPESEIARGCVIERPKVLYNAATGKFVMWVHLELKGHGYNAARAGCAVSDSPTGPFEYLGSVRPNAGRFPMNISEALKQRVLDEDWEKADGAKETKPQAADRLFVRDFYGGQMARDMTLFLDDDGTAYHVFASEENLTLHVAELDETFTRHTGRWARVRVGGHREGPALFKRDGKYHLITSACTGWSPNAAEHAVADSVWGPYEPTGNPCVGEGPFGGPSVTFGAQSTFVLPIEGPGENGQDAFVFMADVWRPDNHIDGRYIWLPIEFEDGVPVLRWRDSWSPGVALPGAR